MTTIAEVREDMATVLRNLEGWSVASGYIGDMVNTYSLKIGRPAFDPRMVFQQAKAVHQFTVAAYAPRATPEVSEAALDALCELSGSGSLIATVQNGAHWTASIDYAVVTNCGEVQVITWIDGVDYLAVQFTIEVCF